VYAGQGPCIAGAHPRDAEGGETMVTTGQRRCGDCIHCGSVWKLRCDSFGIMSYLGGPLTSGFAMGDPENPVFLVLPFAIACGLCKYSKLPNSASFMIALIIGSVGFTLEHSLVYSTNMVATAIVLIFGIISLASYYFTKSVVIMSSLHVGNNFWGALFSVSVIGFSAFGVSSPVSSLMTSVVLLIGMAASVYVLVKRSKRKK